jgi:hypothetical protein
MSAVRAAEKSVHPIVEEKMPGAVRELTSIIGAEKAIPILNEYALVLQEERTVLKVPPTKKDVSDSGTGDSRYLSFMNKDYRPQEALSYDTVDDMLRNGMVVFTLAIKQSAIHSVLRNDQSWRVVTDDERIDSMVRGMMNRVFRNCGKEFMEFMPYGAAFFEKEWEYRTAKEWGIEGADGKFWGYSALEAIHPGSIKWIDYIKDGHTFDGFTQQRRSGEDAKIEVDKALILTYDKKFRNLWGNPATEPMYPYWFWLEVVWRSFLRYLERTGTPVTVVQAPAQGYVLTPDGERVQTMKYALEQAGYIAFSNAAAFPSDVDPDSGQRLWEVNYLQDQSRGDQFIDAIAELGTAMSRSVVIGDNAATQTGNVESRASAQTHWEVTQLHNQMILDELLEQVNEYVVAPLVTYNAVKGSTAYIETQTLDQAKLDRLFSLLNTMGNQQDSDIMSRIDWAKMLEINDVPMLSDEDVEKVREEKMQRAVDQQKAFAQVAADTQQPLRKTDGSAPKQQQPPGQAEQKVKQSAQWPLWQLVNGAIVPMLLTDEQLQEAQDRGRERASVFDMHTDETLRFFEFVFEEYGMHISDEEFGIVRFCDDEDLVDAVLEWWNSDFEIIELGAEERRARRAARRKKRKAFFSRLKEVAGGIAEKAKAIGKAIIDALGRIWDPSKHPRDPSGKFAKAGSTAQIDSRIEQEIDAMAPEPIPEEAYRGVSFDVEVGESERFYIGRGLQKILDDPFLSKNINTSALHVVGTGAGARTVGGWFDADTHNANIAMDGFRRSLGNAINQDERDYVNSLIEKVTIHELLHADRHKEAGRAFWSGKRKISIEEPIVEMLSNRAMGQDLAQQTPSAYGISTEFVAQMAMKASSNDVGKAWSRIESIYEGGNSLDEQMALLKDAYPALKKNTPGAIIARTQIRRRFNRGKRDPAGDFGTVWRGAEQMALEFTHGDEWQQHIPGRNYSERMLAQQWSSADFESYIDEDTRAGIREELREKYYSPAQWRAYQRKKNREPADIDTSQWRDVGGGIKVGPVTRVE